jgi:hypothetical protein
MLTISERTESGHDLFKNSYVRFGKPLKNTVDEPENEVALGIVKENKQGGKELFFEISTSA